MFVEEKSMKRRILVILSLLLIALPMATLIAPARASLNGFSWLNPAYIGEDPSLSTSADIIGYVEGTNWNFTMTWTNTDWTVDAINITTVRVWFDWNKNYTHRFGAPIQLKYGETRTFKIYNTTASTTEAPEQWPHTYYIYLDQANNTVAPYKELAGIYVYSDSYFMVLSQDHVTCLSLWAKYHTIFGSYYSMPFNITKAQVLFLQAYTEFTQGESFFEKKDYINAKTHFTACDTNYINAISTWDTRGTSMEDADLAYKNALADNAKKSGDAAINNSYGWIFFGLGWTLIGLGLIIYAMKRPKTPQPPQA